MVGRESGMHSQLANELIEMFTRFVRAVERREVAPPPPTDSDNLPKLHYTVSPSE
jgi:hypothetical protein